MQHVRSGVARVHAVAVDDDAGPVRRDQGVGVGALGHRENDVAGGERGEVVGQCVDVVAGLEQDDGAVGAEFVGARLHPVGEFAIAQPGGVGEHGGAVREPAQMVEQRPHEGDLTCRRRGRRWGGRSLTSGCTCSGT